MKNIKIIDTHFHIWDLNKIKLEWISEVSSLNDNFSFTDYLNEYNGLNLIGSIYLEVDSKNKNDEFDYIANLSRQKSNILGFITSIEINNAKHYKLLGFRKILSNKANMEALQADLEKFDSNMVFEVCIHSSHISDIENIAIRYPNIKFIINHFGNPNYEEDIEEWIKNIKSISKLSNVFLKLSCMDNFNNKTSKDVFKRLINTSVESFDKNNLLFGSNYPVSGIKPGQWAEIVYENLSDNNMDSKDIEDIFYTNALKCYSIKPPTKRFGQIIKVKKDKLNYYKKLHSDVWSGVNDRIKNSNIRNYSIYHYGEFLFAYFEYIGFDFKKDMEDMAKDAITRKWWEETNDCQIKLEGSNQWSDMEEVFHLD